MESEFKVEKYRYDYEIVRLTAEQVIKDFGTHAIEIGFSGDPLTAYEELLNQLVPVLESLYKDQPVKLSALLYRIDIEEAKWKELPSGKERFVRLAEMIVQREFKKVLIRKYFSDSGRG